MMFTGLLAFGSVGVGFSDRPDPRAIVGEIVALSGTSVRSLANDPESVTAVYSYTSNGTRIDYVAGVDYTVTASGIARTANSAIYNFASYAVATKPDGKFTWVDSPRNPPFTKFLHTYVDYVARRDVDIIPARAATPVTGRILAAGDSITGGADTVARSAFGTDADGYVGLLRDQFDGQFQVENFSLSGSGLSVLTAQLPTILANPPSVIIIAFGMNDHSDGPSGLASFKSELLSDVNQIKAAGSRAILVGFPRKNPLWENYSLSDIMAYNDAIHQVANQTSSPFVDIQSAFEQARKVKTTIELFGDNYHHPGNYGHRIYFSKILPHLLSVPLSETQAPAYVSIP